MRKYKLKFFIINLITAIGIGLSAFFPWLGGLAPKDIILSQIVPFDLPTDISSAYLSAAAVVLAGAAFVFVGAIFSLRSMVLFGIILNIALVIFWAISLGFHIESYEGFGLLCFSLTISLLSLFIRRRAKESKK